MLRIRPRHRPTKSELRIRMNPAKQTSSTPLETRCAWSAASNPFFPDKLRKSIAFAATPAFCAAASPGALGSSDTTSEISAENSVSRAAWIRALILDPRPEMRMAVRTRSIKEEAFRG